MGTGVAATARIGVTAGVEVVEPHLTTVWQAVGVDVAEAVAPTLGPQAEARNSGTRNAERAFSSRSWPSRTVEMPLTLPDR